MKQMDAYIGIRGAANSSQFADVPLAQMDLYQQHWWHPVHSEIRVPKTKWVVLRYPTDAMAQAANMSTAAFEDFYFRRLHGRLRPDGQGPGAAGARMRAADRVRIVSPGTDLTFSIGLDVRPCYGQRNIPGWRGVHRADARQP